MKSPAVLDVELEAVDTWPPEFLQAAMQNRELILSFQRERQRIGRLGWDDILVRINPPENRYEDEYKALVDRLDESLVRHRIVGYHCTRLTPGEIRTIKANGLRLLSTDLVRQRLDSCVADGHMTSVQCEYLVGSQIMRESLGNRHGHRTGIIWFCPNRSTLQESSGVYRLFRSWGGEAVYLGHEEDEKIATVLAGIGTPCIVKCAIPFPCDDPYYPQFAARFFSQFISNDFEYPEPSPGFDLCTKRDLLGAEVLEVIDYSDPRFESLTGCSNWPAPYRIIGAT